MTMHSERHTLIALGGNLGDPYTTIRKAVTMIQQGLGSVVSVSRLYRTRALVLPGMEESLHPDYLNAALVCRTVLASHEILHTLLAIERDLGRDRKREERWGARLIDLDLIAVGQDVISSEELTLPHPEMHRRDFVLQPLMDIAPDFVHPRMGMTVRELYRAYQDSCAQGYVLGEFVPMVSGHAL